LLRSLGRGRSGGRSGGAAATTATGITAGRAARIAAVVAAEHGLEQLEHRTAVQLVALHLRLAGRFASRLAGDLFARIAACLGARIAAASLLAATNLTALRRFLAASGFRAASRRGRARHGLALDALGREHVRDVREQVAHRGRPALLAARAAVGLGTGFWAGLRTGFRATGLGAGIAASNFALAAATAVQPKHAIQEFEAEPLAAQSDAHQERSKNRLASH